MNYIIYNGQNTRDLKGLLVMELPPISKPEMRVETIEIEGKDGNLTEDMGYGVYDKLVKIGVYGDYDIDLISKFFSGEGKVTFSNEPDKYYNAKIKDQIDFDQLVKYRIATVKFHTQPFKYLVSEEFQEVQITPEITSVVVKNQGLEDSKPVITLTGNGVIQLAINNLTQFQVEIDSEYLTVNCELEECYKDDLNTLKNRQMGGIFPALNSGDNTITWTGNLTKIKIEPMSRWL